jgi:hypothetical protein
MRAINPNQRNVEGAEEHTEKYVLVVLKNSSLSIPDAPSCHPAPFGETLGVQRFVLYTAVMLPVQQANQHAHTNRECFLF